MPTVDYSKTEIYKIKCKNPRVKYSEIFAATNIKCVRYRFRKIDTQPNNSKLHQEITANGGVANWEIVLLESYPECSSKAESNSRVAYWRNRENDLSIFAPKPSKMLQNAPKCSENQEKTYYCKFCDYNYSNNHNYNKHLLTAKHAKSKKKYMKLIEMDKQRTCKHCSRTFATRGSLIRHNGRCKVLKNWNQSLEKKIEMLQNELNRMNARIDRRQL